MRDMGRVQGSEAQAKELIIGVDTVYVHSNIELKETEYGNIYEYDEIQYTKDEYITLMAENISETSTDNVVNKEEITDLQLGLVDTFESLSNKISQLEERLQALEGN